MAAQHQSEGAQSLLPKHSLSLLPLDRMTAEDRAVAEAWRPAISGSARFYGYAVDSAYTYREIACPAAPRHLLLAYERAERNGSVSRFTVVVPRALPDGPPPRVSPQIVPILHFGVTPFVPAMASPHAIEVFNAAVSSGPEAVAVLSETEEGKQPLLVRALCYLAMVGEEPVAIPADSPDPATIQAPLPTLQFLGRGEIRQLVSVRNEAATYQVWGLTFTSSGRLVASAREQHSVDKVNATAPSMKQAAAAQPLPTPEVAASTPRISRLPERAPVSTSAASVASSPAVPTAPGEAAARESAAMHPGEPGASVAAAPSVPVSAVASPDTVSVSAELPAASPAGYSASPAVAARPTGRVTRLMPPGRFIPDPPAPPGRFIPDSALKLPPHLPR